MVFLRTTKRITAHKEVGGSLRYNVNFPPLRRVQGTRQPRRARAEASNRSRKSQCPSPPWDTAFPGAFFLARMSHVL